jgi:hypothetical protein
MEFDLPGIETVARFGLIDEWHLDLASFLNLGKLENHPVSPL